jgi:glycogen operon protein
MISAYWEPLSFELPSTLAIGEGEASPWRRWIDTALASPDDVMPWESAPAVEAASYTVQPHSVVVLIALLSRPSVVQAESR